MDESEHLCQRPRAPEQSPHVQGGDRPKSDHVAEDDGVPRRPVQDRNPEEGAAAKPQIGHQRGGGVGGDGAHADGLWCKDKAEAHEGHVDRGDAEQDTEFHGKRVLSVDN